MENTNRTDTNRETLIGKYNPKNTHQKIKFGGYTSEKYKPKDTNLGNSNRNVQIGKHNSEGARRNIQTVKKTEIQITKNPKKRRTGNTNRGNTSQKSTRRRIQIGRYISENTNQKIQVGEYKSGNTNRNILF